MALRSPQSHIAFDAKKSRSNFAFKINDNEFDFENNDN